MKGRKPKPTRLKVVEGNPGKRTLKNEPRPQLASVDPPAGMDGVALDEWNRVAPALRRLGLLTKLDRPALEAYCYTWESYVDARDDCRVNGIYYLSDKGLEKKRPAASVALETSKELRAFCSLFGFSPADRVRLHVDPPDESEEEAVARHHFGS